MKHGLSYGQGGVFITCRMGKERQCLAEVMNIFQLLSDEIWPTETKDESGLDIEESIGRELERLRLPPKDQRFQNIQTNTPCLVYVQCALPLDPVKLVLSYLRQVAESQTCQTRFVERFAPISCSCFASFEDLRRLTESYLPNAFRELAPEPLKYKVEIKLRNHNLIDRMEAIELVVKYVPSQHSIDLEHPDVVVLVEIFKNLCGLSLLPHYYLYQRYSPWRTIETTKTMEDRYSN